MKRLAYLAGALLVLAITAVLVAPSLIDSAAARAEIQRRLSQALQGQIDWQALDLALFPVPRGELRQVRVEIPGKLSAAADEVNVYLALWPLLRGSPEVSSVSVLRPRLRVARTGKSDEPLDYRTTMEAAARALREYAPDMALRIEQATVELPDGFVLREVNARGRTGSKGVDVELDAASDWWKRVNAKARMEYADLSARATAELTDLELARLALPVAVEGKVSLKASASLEKTWQALLEVTRTDAAIKVDALPWKIEPRTGRVTVTPERIVVAGVDGALGKSSFSGLAAELDGKRILSGSGRATVPLEQWLPWLELEEITSASGSADVQLERLALSFERPKEVDFEALVTPRNLNATLKSLPVPLSVNSGSVRATRTRYALHGVAGTLGASSFSGVAAHIDPKGISSASGRASVALAEWLPLLKREEIISVSGAAEVALNRLALRFDRPAQADYDAVVTPRKVSAELKMLPAPVAVDGGSVSVVAGQARLDKVAANLLDANVVVSGSVGKTIELALSNGVAGEKLVRWALERAQVPPRFAPKTPLRFAAQRIGWQPDGALEADARVDFEGGPALGVALAWRPELLELRRVTIKDARSDAAFTATVAGDLIQASFSGTLAGHSIPAMLRQPLPAGSGVAQGELRATIDRRSPERTLAEGKLRITALDLSWLAGRKVLIERADIVSDRAATRVSGARFGWEEQYFELSGEGRRTAQGPVIDARIESAGVDVLRLLPPPAKSEPRTKPSAIWPLPLSGRIEMSTAFAQYKAYRIEPLAGVLTLEPERARLEVKQARMCGVSFPMEIEARPDDNSAAVHVAMKDEPLERAVRCLTGGNLELSGSADLTAELRTQGRRPHLLRDLTGTAQAEVRDGRVKKFALIGNLLAFRGIASLEDMKSDGFPFRRMTAKGQFGGGQFRLEEGFFDSNAARLAAHGRIDLLGADSQLNVLIAPLTTVERVVGAIPLLGDVFGGTMVALPVAVHGDIRNPYVVPLGPRAISDQLLGIFERTLKLPGKLAVPEQPKP